MATQPNLHGQATLLLLPKYIQKVYKFYNTHNKTEKELEFNEGWAFYFATKLKDQIENINELEKLKNE